ncbi:hypothetical protein DY000_02031420 [Brassica cretica]|uniref:Uncharacterized protein n=1 Tax=Brassica cretica TaxID=69181 RepID=A0ABQ7DHB8_BRACR|nr:hypothetical protein DY000_02031420 [Brassica cretica]
MITSWASSTAWGYTQMVRREGRRPDSTPRGQDSLVGRCSVEAVSWEINGREHWCDPWRDLINTGNDGSRCLIGLIKGCNGCKSRTDWLRWDMVPWPVSWTWYHKLIRKKDMGQCMSRSWMQYMAAGHSSVLAQFECDSSISWSISSFSNSSWADEQTSTVDVAKYKTVALAEASLKGVTPPSFKDAPTISPAAGMEVNLSVKPDGSST